jgi:hypothetical protein
MWAQGLLEALLTALSTRPAAALLSAPTVHLCTNTPSLVPGMAVAAFTETIYTGYAAIALPTLSGPVWFGQGQLYGMFGGVNFLGPSSGGPASITGYYVTDGGGTVLYGAELFPTPIGLALPTDFLDLTVILPLLTRPQVS